jgi:hypothetical protein
MKMIEQILPLEESLWKARTRFDIRYMDSILHPDFFEFGRSGRRYDRETVLTAPAQPIDVTWPLQDFRLHTIDESTILVTYISEVTYDGQIELTNRSSLWKKGSRWQLRFHQGTPTHR